MTADRFIEHIAQTLGRPTPTVGPPSTKPSIDEGIARLVGGTQETSELFVQRAQAAKIHVTRCATQTQSAEAVERLFQSNGWKSAVITKGQDLESFGLLDTLRRAGVAVQDWDEATLDSTYDVDVGITDVWAAVAETGSIVVKSSASHGRAVSLVPPAHVAIVRKSQILPDLIDLMAKVQREGSGAGIVIITGPSKTADIEMNLVTGVHGPGEVQVLLVD